MPDVRIPSDNPELVPFVNTVFAFLLGRYGKGLLAPVERWWKRRKRRKRQEQIKASKKSNRRPRRQESQVTKKPARKGRALATGKKSKL